MYHVLLERMGQLRSSAMRAACSAFRHNLPLAAWWSVRPYMPALTTIAPSSTHGITMRLQVAPASSLQFPLPHGPSHLSLNPDRLSVPQFFHFLQPPSLNTDRPAHLLFFNSGEASSDKNFLQVQNLVPITGFSGAAFFSSSSSPTDFPIFPPLLQQQHRHSIPPFPTSPGRP